jgi:hypothetical protein
VSGVQGALKNLIDAECATVAGVGEVLELVQELAETGAELLTSYENMVVDAEARRRLAQTMMLLELAAETIAKALNHHDAQVCRAPRVPT